MAGGLLNIISFGNQNIILSGNPNTTMFKSVFLKYTNFGLQKLRLDYEGQKNLNLDNDLDLSFKVKRYSDLLLDTYLVFNLPDIWSPILPPEDYQDCWKPFHFRWIKHIGANIIKKASIVINGQTIQSFTGEYLKTIVARDFPSAKREKFYKMIGHEEELYRPENAYNRKNKNRYPNVYYQQNVTPEPSIRGRTIYVPLHFWFSFSSKNALPLVALQNCEVSINLTLRPIRDLFTINDVTLNKENGFNTNNPIKPNFVNDLHLPYRFLTPPTDFSLSKSQYNRSNNIWDTDIHLISTYGFLTMEEARVFALNEQKYLIKDVMETDHLNIVGSNTIKIESNSLVTSWCWFFRRHDYLERNEYSNYSNWKYGELLPSDLEYAPSSSPFSINGVLIGPGTDFTGSRTALQDGTSSFDTISSQHFITPSQDINNIKNIMTRCSILFDGQHRENDFDSGIYHYIEKYRYCEGGIDYDGIYSYSYGLNTSPFDLQPSGAINLSRFKKIELVLSTILPPVDASNASFNVVCDVEGTPIGISENSSSSIFDHTFDLHIMEERYNILRIIGGQAGLVFAR
jgi:hypothetical protein